MNRSFPLSECLPEDPVERATYYLAAARAEFMLKGGRSAGRVAHLNLVPDETVVPIHFNETTFRFNPTFVLRASEEELAELWRDVAKGLSRK
jgi:hypothetical protein